MAELSEMTAQLQKAVTASGGLDRSRRHGA